MFSLKHQVKETIMKKIATTATSVFLLFTATAQQAYFGLKGGVNVSRLHFNNNEVSSNSRTGLNVGMFATIPASATWAVQPELLYSPEGGRKAGDGQTDYNLNYLNVPVLLQYMLNHGLRVEGGAQIGFLLNAKIRSGNITANNTGFRSTAFSIPLGVGYLASSDVGLDLRYLFGLSNINDSENGRVTQSNVFQLGIFYRLRDINIHSRRR
jgi:hypothetical protein